MDIAWLHRQQVIEQQQQLAAQIDHKLFLSCTERRLQPVHSMTGVMHCGSVAPLAHGVHADAVVLGQLPAAAARLLQCQTGGRRSGRVLVQGSQRGKSLAEV